MTERPPLPAAPLTPKRALDLFQGRAGKPPMDTAAIAKACGRDEAEIVRLLADAREERR